MKSFKVFVLGQRMKDVYPHATKWQVFKYRVAIFFRRLCIFVGYGVGIVLIFLAGSYLMPKTVSKEVVKEVPAAETIPPVLTRIANCESPTGQYDATGQVTVVGNKNGSVDVGKYQINERLWGKKATELGYNLFNEKDNEAMALWIYHNKGTEDWVWSKPCWVR